LRDNLQSKIYNLKWYEKENLHDRPDRGRATD